MLNFASGVGAAEDGGRPRSSLCAGVKAISDRSSSFRTNGKQARMMLVNGISWRRSHAQSRYV